MRISAPLVLAVCALALAGCSGDSDSSDAGPTTPKQPAESAFAEGTCRSIAPDVLSIGKDARSLGDGGEVDKDVLTRLEQAQTRLRAVVEGAEPAYKPAIDKLVVAVGLVRFQAKPGRYQPQTGDNLVASYDGVVDVCTGPAASSSP
jgi:hypothetical protein